MWQRVERAVEDLKPLVGSIGLDLRVDDVINQVVTLEVRRTDPQSRPDMGRLRDFVTRELKEVVPEIHEVRYLGDALAADPSPGAIEVRINTPDERADTVVVRTSAPVGPEATATFDRPSEAADWPVVQALLGIEGVVSVVARDTLIILARDESVGWSSILPQIEPGVRGALGPSTPADVDGVRERVQVILDRDINPALSSHGGFIEVVDYREGDLYIHMGGGCQGCAQSQATLRQGVERQLKDQIPEIRAIYDQTDHAAGTDPYFR
ncbi:MAG: hypothetical protein EA397_00400 [Deltaproteobacteria bacterium]|nr:MAG: hypothetical protein EA397_00400 [Deltaproteobacteria bacterium]